MQNNRYEVLDGLRGVAAISVMFMHYLQHTQTPIFKNAYLSVDFFFMLSGFVLAHSYKERLLNGLSAVDYMGKRLIRLYPMFLISLVIGTPALFLAIRYGLSDFPRRSAAVASLYNLFFTPYFGGYATHNMASLVAPSQVDATVGEIFPANPAAWSLFFELLASLFFVSIARLGRGTLIRIALISGTAFTATGLLLAFERHGTAIYFGGGWGTSNFVSGLFRVTYGFTMGVLLHDLHKFAAHIRPGFGASKVLGNSISMYLVFVVLVLTPFAVRGAYAMAIIFVVGPLLVFQGASIQNEKPILSKAGKFLGWLSYPVYCLHFPIGRLVFMFMPASLQRTMWPVAISAAVTFLAAAVLAKFVDEPVRQYLTRKFSRAPSKQRERALVGSA
ncbi:acyltransferase family protein [Paraburkholderia sediminicola]|uniref:acyltransferase family protein n=1 Tax=Paraburkholderia sediminicola TaxID=458836 RepID=UPI0038B6CCA7